ncbi:hypothetical protein BX616_010888 [Lobosporangium transversale]|uniref:ER-bound oxygenase mpaB/mpaB'/Rubber oxygenase catalytic domain-containing protein n=1 Tax=Lobosporangium transversale TaxID=64571 RepID=A0A1Y2G6G9_9FUNG|nr:hypothetical protein BCR41DRAFT_365389 [Lobosporangium transversale]KAF9910294.1 hypothetical protein BX616_010888 [Lobosporangium transversale]ORY94314.1 hypothetical protein BCR41DRAFT_365389 [Lobosporangium transversale]|eukprot:XP_021875257.1 hypothetical protein BCR41DRAFT_365389 [Lobosporangium transversale]
MDILLNVVTSSPGAKYAALVLSYMAVVRYFRYKRINAALKKYPDPTIPLRNFEVAKEVAAIVDEFDFPYMNIVSLEFALYKTYAIPTISKILAATKQFENNVLKRADDTSLMLLELTEPYARNLRRCMLEGKEDPNEILNDEKRYEISMTKLNFLHGRYNIKQEDFLYTLGLFIEEPPSFIAQFEWRPLTELEKNAIFAIWAHHGKRMGIKNIPETKEDFKAWCDEYERQNSVYAPTNAKIAGVTTDLLLSLAPKFMHPFGRHAVSALLTPRLRAAFKVAPPPLGVTTLIRATLKARALFVRYFMLPRRLPHVRTGVRANSEGKYVPAHNKYEPVYPNGYKVEDLGPEKFIGKCPFPTHLVPSQEPATPLYVLD